MNYHIFLKAEEYTVLWEFHYKINNAKEIDKKYRQMELFTYLEDMCGRYKEEGRLDAIKANENIK